MKQMLNIHLLLLVKASIPERRTSDILKIHTEVTQLKKGKIDEDLEIKKKEIKIKQKEIELKQKEIDLKKKSKEKMKLIKLQMQERLAMEELKLKYKQ